MPAAARARGMAWLDGWLDMPPERIARHAKWEYATGVLFTLVFLGHLLVAVMQEWDMTWNNVFLPMTWLFAGLLSFIRAYDGRRAHQALARGGSL